MLLLHWWRTGAALILQWCCARTVLVLYWQHDATVRVQHSYCTCLVLCRHWRRTVSTLFPTSVVHWWHYIVGAALVLHGSFPGTALVLR